MQQPHSPKFLRQRKFLLVAPLLVLPFMTLFFWAIGGGKEDTSSKKAAVQHGINLSLPDARFKNDKGADKMAYYNLAAADSAKNAEKHKNLSFFEMAMRAGDSNSALRPGALPKNSASYADPNEAKVYRKLDELNAALGQAANATSNVPAVPMGSRPAVAPLSSPDLDRMEKMMHAIENKGDTDEELKQLNTVLDKLIRVQHPEAARDTPAIAQRSNNLALLASRAAPSTATALLLPRDSIKPASNGTGFHGTYAQHSAAQQGNAFRAVIPESQTLVAGATVKLELLDDISIGGNTILRGSFVYGLASLTNERLSISVRSLRAGDNIFPVSLEAYDEDGVAGLYMPGAITRDVAKQSVDEGINSVGVTSMDPSLGAQATSAGIQMARSLFSKKVKLVQVSVRAGYQVWLKNAGQH